MQHIIADQALAGREPVADGQGFAAVQQIGEKGAGLGGDLISFLIGPPIMSANDLIIGGRDH